MVTEEPRNAEDTSRDYKDLDGTAGSAAPDDPRSSGTDSGLTAGGMGTGVEGCGDSAGGSPGNHGGPRPAVPAAAASAETHGPKYMM